MVAKNITLVSLLGSAKAKLFNTFHWLKNFMYLAILNTLKNNVINLEFNFHVVYEQNQIKGYITSNINN